MQIGGLFFLTKKLKQLIISNLFFFVKKGITA